MEELWTDTGRSPGAPESPTAKPRYDVYFSYDPADGERVREISERLQVLGPDFRWFDEREKVPGRLEIETREQALAQSGSLAVLLGPARPSNMAMEEITQSISLSVKRKIPAFFVYLPGSADAGEPELSSWLGARTPADLREQFDEDGRLAREGLVSLIAAVRGMSFREADQWLKQQEAPPSGTPARPPRQRAMITGIEHYEHYEDLPFTRADVQSLRQLFGSATESKWELIPFDQGTKDDLASTAKSFFGTGAEADTLIFYFSGHGAVVERDLYLVVRTTQPDDVMITAFPIRALANYVRGSRSRRKLVILDCCFSGEAADGVDWGAGSAVLMTCPQVVAAGEGTSDLTRAIIAAWEAGAETTGDLLDGLGDVEVRNNGDFDRSIPLPRMVAATPGPAADVPPSARLSFNERGELHVSLSPLDKAGKAHRVEMAGWDDGRQHLVTSLIEMIDLVVSLVPPESLPMKIVKEALLSLGGELLSSTLTEAVRAALGADLAASPQLRLELSFDDRWAGRGSWEQLPWESLVLCKDGDRPVWLERIVRAKATKGVTWRRPSRAIVWNAFREPTPRYATGARHLLTHLLQAEVARHPDSPTLLVKESAQWGDLYQSTVDGGIAKQPGGSPEKIPITDFDTFMLFAPVSVLNGEPVVWFPKGAAAQLTRVSGLAERLREWAFSYLIIETIAGNATPLQGSSDLGAPQACGPQATTQLATRLARILGVNVVAVCHTPRFIELARPAEGEEMTFVPSFSGQLLRQLADSSQTLSAAAHAARRLILEGLGVDDSLDIGLPVVCRPEPDRPEARTASRRAQPSLSPGTPAKR